jgi:arginyl-tRNA synthetase
MMLYRKNDATLDFDLAKVVEQSKDNPVFYVQYAHARTQSLLTGMLAQTVADLDPAGREVSGADLSLLADPAELDLVRKLAEFPRLVEGAARAHEPHRLAFYLYEAASVFHGLWQAGVVSPHLRFIQQQNRALTAARMALVAATAEVLAAGLGVLGVHAPKEMR